MAKLTSVKHAFTFELSLDEVRYIKEMTKNAAENESAWHDMNRQDLFRAMKAALESVKNNNTGE